MRGKRLTKAERKLRGIWSREVAATTEAQKFPTSLFSIAENNKTFFAKQTDLYPGQWGALNKLPPTYGKVAAEKQLEFGFVEPFKRSVRKSLAQAEKIRQLQQISFAEGITLDKAMDHQKSMQAAMSNLGTAKWFPEGYERLSMDDQISLAASSTTKYNPAYNEAGTRINLSKLSGSRNTMASEILDMTQDAYTAKATPAAFDYAQKRVVRDAIRNEFSGDFMKENSGLISDPKQLDALIKKRAKFAQTTIWPGMKPDEITLEHLQNIRSSIGRKGLVMEGGSESLDSLFSGIKDLDKWGRRRKFYEIRAKLFGGLYNPEEGIPQYFETSEFKLGKGRLPRGLGWTEDNLERLTGEYLEKYGDLKGSSYGGEASEITYKQKADYAFKSTDDVFELRKAEAEATEDLYRSFSNDTNASKSTKNLYNLRKRAYKDWLKKIDPGQRHAIERYYLVKNSGSKLSKSYRGALDTIEIDAMNAMKASNPNMSDMEIDLTLKKLRSPKRGSVIGAADLREYPRGLEYIQGPVSTIEKVHRRQLMSLGVSTEDIALASDRVPGMLAMEDVAYGTTRSQGSFADSTKNVRRPFGKNVRGGITQSELLSVDDFYANNPRYLPLSARGTTGGVVGMDAVVALNQKLQRISSQGGFPLIDGGSRKGNLSKILTTAVPYTTAEQKKMAQSSKNRALGGSYRRGGISSQLRRINERYKMEGSSKGLMAFDLETTGYGQGARFSRGTRDYITQMGWSKSRGGGSEFLVNQFEGGEASSSLKSRYYARNLDGKQVGPFSVTGVHIKDIETKGISSRAAAGRFMRAGKFGTPDASLLLGANAEKFDIPLFMRNILPKESYGLHSLDVTQMTRDLIEKKNMKLFQEKGFTGIYQLGNIAANLGIEMPQGLHSSRVDAKLTRQVYENLEGVVRAQVDNGNYRFSHYLKENALRYQRSSYLAGQTYMEHLSSVGIKYGTGGGEFTPGATNFLIPKKQAGGFKELGQFLKEGMESTKNREAFVKTIGENYVVKRSVQDLRMAPEVAFATQFEKDFNPFGVRQRDWIRRDFNKGISLENVKNFTKKNWRGVALAGAAIAASAFVVSAWRSRKKGPMERTPGEQGDASLFGGTGMNVMAPPTMEGESPYTESSRAMPMSYAARIMDPTSVATNIRVRGGISNSMDYGALGRAMGIMGSNITGAEGANVNMRVSDNTTKMSDRDIRRKIARMA